jgi:outer membrane receptor protein involved in Fe transport
MWWKDVPRFVQCISSFIMAATLAPVVSTVAYAQLGTATLSGVITDPSGSRIPQTVIRLESTLQKFSRETLTDSEGSYVVTALPPGEYDLSVTALRFKPEKVSKLSLSSGQASTLNLTLSLAATATEVSVVEAPPLLQTTNATLGSEVTAKEMAELPLFGRNFQNMILILPGVSPASSPDARSESFSSTGVNPSVFGQRQRNNNFTIDGGNNNSYGGNDINTFPPPEAIAEMKVESAMSSSAYGVGSGASVNVATKSGTKDFHGALWESFRNAALDARSFFVPSLGQFNWNQFGGAVGGPVIIPHLLSKDNGWYFFGYYEGARVRQAANFFALVPTPEELSGNLAGSPPIYNPYTTVTHPDGTFTREPFANNQIPPSLLNQSSLTVAKAIYPAPNLAAGIVPGANYINSNSNRQTQNQWSLRVDHQFGTKDNFFARYSDDLQKYVTWDLRMSDFILPHKNLLASLTHSFNPSLAATGRFGITRQNRSSTNVGLIPGLAQTAGTAQAFPGGRDESSGEQYELIPGISIPGYAGLGESASLPSPETALYWSGDATKISGSHTIGFGGNYMRYYHNSLGVPGGGSVGYGALQTALGGGTGSALASFLLGIPATASRLIGSSNGITNSASYGLYIQDDYRITPRLTVNLGLRWDYVRPMFNKLGSSGFIWETGLYYWNIQNPITGEPPNIRNTVLDPDRNNLAPRFGIAYQLSSKTVLRAGFGVFYNLYGFEYSQAQQGNRGNWPFATPENVSGINVGLPTVFFPNPFSGPPNPSKTPLGFGQNLNADPSSSRTGYVYEWTLSLQRQLTNSLTLEAAYMGSTARKLDGQILDNTAYFPGPGPIQARQRYPQLPIFVTNGMNIFPAYYNAGTFKIEKRFSQGLSFQANYTWSRNINYKDSAVNGAGGTGASWAGQGPVWGTRFNTRQFKGPASFDVTHRVALSYIYQLPVRTRSKAADALIANWSISGIATFDNGFPYGPRLSIDNENTGVFAGNEFPNVVGNPSLSNPTPQRWFNTDAFAVPRAYTTGNAGRNILRGPGFANWDVSIYKRWLIREPTDVELRGDFFNFLNHTNLGLPSTDLPSPQFGTISATRNNGRSIQLGLKLHF